MDLDFILPRNEHELCDLFESLLFMQTERFSFEPKSEMDEKLKPTDKALSVLNQNNIIGKIFRRWFQTTWGDRNWSRHFAGETPRQELAHMYPKFNIGNAVLSVELLMVDNKWVIRPILCLDKKIEEKTQKSYWEKAAVNLVSESFLDLPKSDILRLGKIINDYLKSIISLQGNGIDDFLSVDGIIFELWDILRMKDDRLIDIEIITRERTTNTVRSKLEIYSTMVFYALGSGFDEYILYPLENFGGVEIVWTDKHHFLQSLVETFYLADHDLEALSTKAEHRKKSHDDYAPEFEKRIFDVNKLWFVPPTSFRFLESSRRYF